MQSIGKLFSLAILLMFDLWGCCAIEAQVCPTPNPNPFIPEIFKKYNEVLITNGCSTKNQELCLGNPVIYKRMTDELVMYWDQNFESISNKFEVNFKIVPNALKYDVEIPVTFSNKKDQTFFSIIPPSRDSLVFTMEELSAKGLMVGTVCSLSDPKEKLITKRRFAFNKNKMGKADPNEMRNFTIHGVSGQFIILHLDGKSNFPIPADEFKFKIK